MGKKLTTEQPPMVRRKTTKEMLPVYFTEQELQSIGLQLAATHQRIGKLTVEKKISADSFAMAVIEQTGDDETATH